MTEQMKVKEETLEHTRASLGTGGETQQESTLSHSHGKT